MASPLGALLEALGQGGMNIAQFRVKERNDAFQRAMEEQQRALEERRFKESSELSRAQLAQQAQQFDLQNADRAEGRRLQRETREQQGAQWAATNLGGHEVDDSQAELIERYIPGGISRKTGVADVEGHAPINGLPVNQAFTKSNVINETQPASVRNALIKAQTETQKNEALNAYRAQRVAIDNARTELMRQRQSLSEQQFAQAEEYLALARQKAEDDFNQTNARIEASLYATDNRAANPTGWDLMSAFPGMGGGVPSGPTAKPATAPPVRPLIPTRSGGGGSTSPTIDDLLSGLQEYIRRNGGGR